MQHLRIVGNFYRSDQGIKAFNNCKEGDPAFLKWTPNNRHDGNAHEVYLNYKDLGTFVHIGFIDRNQAARIVNYAWKLRANKGQLIACRIRRDNPGNYPEIRMLGIGTIGDVSNFMMGL